MKKKKNTKSKPIGDGFSASDYGKFSASGRKKRKTIENKDLEDYTQSDYEDIALSPEEAERFKELKEIIDRIESRPPDKFKIPKKFDDKYQVDYKKELNKEQLQAVVTTKGPLLIIAGAGTGKTRVLTYRTLFLIESGVSPEKILLLTFTKKAAKEMLSRVDKYRPADSLSSDVSGGTFHSLAFRLIREYNQYFEVDMNFTIADVGKSQSIIDLARSDLGFNKRVLEFPTKTRLQRIISTSKNKQITIESVIKKEYSGLEDKIDDINEVIQWYEDYKRNAHILDFDDLMIVLRDTLRDNDDFRKKIQAKYKYVMVDEYQDTNLVQKDIANLITNDEQNIMIVGDDAQSIYEFRGANYENILRFSETFPKCKLIKLNKNYRSRQKLVEFTNSVNNSFKVGYKKHLKSTRKNKGKKPKILQFSDQENEAKYIVDKIFDLHESGVKYCEMAVLCRSGWFWEKVEQEVKKRNIPYVTVGGIKFIEKKHIQDIIAFLSVINYPQELVAWHHILKLYQGVGDKTIGNLAKDLSENNFEISSLKKSHPPKVDTVIKLIEKASNDKISLAKKLSLVTDHYKSTVLESSDENTGKALKEIETFIQLASDYNEIPEFLASIAIESDKFEFVDGITPSVDETEEKPLVLSTIHSAKGLEWKYVFMPHTLDGLIPSSKNLNSIEEEQEENRLFYVATTRAEDGLFITNPTRVYASGVIYDKPSRYIITTDPKTYKYKFISSNEVLGVGSPERSM